MSEYCSKCCHTYGMKEDYDLPPIAYKLKKGYSETFICEGCNVRGVGKDEEGKTYVYYLEGEHLEPKEEVFEWRNDKPKAIIDKISSLLKSFSN